MRVGRWEDGGSVVAQSIQSVINTPDWSCAARFSGQWSGVSAFGQVPPSRFSFSRPGLTLSLSLELVAKKFESLRLLWRVGVLSMFRSVSNAHKDQALRVSTSESQNLQRCRRHYEDAAT